MLKTFTAVLTVSLVVVAMVATPSSGAVINGVMGLYSGQGVIPSGSVWNDLTDGAVNSCGGTTSLVDDSGNATGATFYVDPCNVWPNGSAASATPC